MSRFLVLQTPVTSASNALAICAANVPTPPDALGRDSGLGDLGVLWNEGNQLALNNFIGGYGVGLRLLLPGVSAIRLDFGWGQSGAKVVVRFGVFEKADVQRRRVR